VRLSNEGRPSAASGAVLLLNTGAKVLLGHMVLEIQEFVIRRGVACACRLGPDKWIVAQCLLPFSENGALVRVGTGTSVNKITGNLKEGEYPIP
jgi:hypothetical protein